MGTNTVEASSGRASVGARLRPRSRWRFDAFPYLLLLPSLALIALINLYPFATGFVYSLKSGTLIQAGQFVGIANYTQLLTDPEFQHALVFSALFAFFG